MPRKKLEYTEFYPYHCYNRCNNQDWLFGDLDQAWKIFCTFLVYVEEVYSARTLQFVLMSNHFHWLLFTPEANLSEILNRFLTEVAIAINDVSDRTNHVFGQRYGWSLIKDPVSFGHVTKYILRNPVAAGLTERVEEYKYSSFSNSIGNGQLACGMNRHPWSETLPADIEKYLEWANEGYSPENEEAIRRAIRKSTFKLRRCSQKRKPLNIENSIFET